MPRVLLIAAALLMTFSARAQSVPWVSGEKLTYQLSLQGVGVGKLYLSAEAIPEGWRFKSKLEAQGIAAFSGYGLESESQTGSGFYTDRFWKNLTEPFKGTTRLVFEREENAGSWAKITQPDGKQTTWRSPSEEVFDELSLIYLLRVRQDIRQVNVVDYPKLAQGQIQSLPRGGDGLVGYRFAREDFLIEIWYRPDGKRTPSKVVLGRDFGRLEATLIENGR